MQTGRASAKVYNAETHDPYETLVAWYRKRLVGAKESESGFVKDTLTFSLPHTKGSLKCCLLRTGTEVSPAAA